jgi:hypothetical protein
MLRLSALVFGGAKRRAIPALSNFRNGPRV